MPNATSSSDATPMSNRPIDAHAGMQVGLTVLALAALPITAWLYIADYVEARVDTAITRYDSRVQTTLQRHTQEIDYLQEYARQLCTEARQSDPSFSCERPDSYRYQPYLRR